MTDMIFDTIAIGGGPAGLTAGYLLAKGGRRVAVLEANPTHLGGISRTASYKGFFFDIGGHRFFSKSSAVVDLWNEILPEDFIDRPRLSRIYYDKKFYSYPLKAFEAFINLGPIESIACVASYIRAQIQPIANPTSLHEWVRNKFGERLFGIFFKTYTEKVWGMSCDEISADWAAQRIKGLSLRAAMLDALRRSLGLHGTKPVPGGATIKTLIEQFRYPRRGPGMLWEECGRKIESLGGTIHRGHRVETLAWNPLWNCFVVSARTPDGFERTFKARHVISSAPIRDLARMLDLPREIRQYAETLRYRDFITVALIVNKSDLFPDNWIYIHDPSVKVGRVQNFRSWSPEMVPDPKLSCLGLEYFCFEGDGLWTAPDEELIMLATRELAAIGLATAAEVIDGHVVREPKAYPVYDADYRVNVGVVRDALEERFPTLYLVGRNGMHKYNNQDHAMMTAMLTVENIFAGFRRYDVWQVNEDAEYHEAGIEGADKALRSERLVPERVAS